METVRGLDPDHASRELCELAVDVPLLPARHHLLEGLVEVLALDLVLRDLLVLLGLSGEDVLSNRQHHRLVADCGEVGAGVAVGPLRYRREIDVIGEGLLAACSK